MIERFFISLLIFALIFFGLPDDSYSRPLGSNMQRLCAMSEKMAFTPLIESIRSPNKDPLINGIEIGSNIDETTRLLAGRHPDSIIILDATPLLYASIAGNWQAAKALLSAGADVNYKTSTGATPLEMAVTKSHFSMACSLIERGAKIPTSIDERNDLMRTTLAMNPRDAEWGAVFLDYLLSNRFDVDEDGSERSNPLMNAVSLHN